MKVLHVITGLDAGGAELQLAMILRRTRHEADVVILGRTLTASILGRFGGDQ